MRGAKIKTVAKIFFTDVFNVDPKVLEKYGAMDVALVNDLPLFVDPFLLYDSKKRKYRDLHAEIINYLCFVRDRAVSGELTQAAMPQWLYFKEIKQNWLGFSKTGNRGTGLGKKFAESLKTNLKTVFREFGNETLSDGSHIEKLGLLDGGVGRDHLSDFTTNIIKGFLLNYTQEFARRHLAPNQRGKFTVERVSFNYDTRRWTRGVFDLPKWRGDFVLLTPKEILTRDEAWINQRDMLNNFTSVCAAIPDAALRAQVNEHFFSQITRKTKENEKRQAALRTIEKFDELLDYYIHMKEQHGGDAHRASSQKVRASEEQFIDNVRALVTGYLLEGPFYSLGDSYADSLRRVAYLKDVIENKGGHRLFYIKRKPVRRETDLHIMFRLTWYGTALDVNAEVNNGRGAVDFKISRGKSDASLVEFKLAKNTGLEKNLRHQVSIYQRASDATRAIKVIVYFSFHEKRRVERILKRLKLADSPDVVLIDARGKVSASRANDESE